MLEEEAPVLTGGRQLRTGGWPALYAIFLLVGFLTPFPSLEWGWVVALSAFLLTRSNLASALRRPCLWAFIGLALASSLWSAASRTLEASLVLCADAYVGVCLATNWSTRAISRLTAYALLVVLALNVGVVLFGGAGQGLNDHGDWKGLEPHENALGRIAGLAVVLAWAQPAPLAFGLACLGALALWQSSAVTPWFAVAICLAGRLLLRLSRLRAMLAAALLLLLLVVGREGLLAVAHREPSLSGRVKIWSASMRALSHSPWWGRGYAAQEPPGFSGILHCHNGVLSLLLQLGLIGATLFWLDLGWVLARTLGSYRGDFDQVTPLLYLLYFGGMNLVECTPPHPGHFSEWILYVAATQKLLLVSARDDSGRPP